MGFWNTTAKVTAQHDIIYSTIKGKMDQESGAICRPIRQQEAIDTIIQQNNIECDFSATRLCLYPGRNYILQYRKNMKQLSMGFRSFYGNSFLQG